MAYCSNCGCRVADGITFCQNCGARTPYNVRRPVNSYPQPQRYYSPPNVAYPPYSMRPANVDTTGLIIWSVFSMICCFIPGIIAFIYALGINSCQTREEQRHKISVAKTCCIISTVLVGLSVFFLASL